MSAQELLDDDGWWPEYKPTEQHCEACGAWLGYNYPAFYCDECKPTTTEAQK